MGEPAGLPRFEDLAQRVALGTGKSRDSDESVDQFLGRLAHSGIDIHRRAAAKLLQGDPQPTSLHHEILRCFRNQETARVVTTNFDQLFEEAWAETSITNLNVYTAPSLPLGDDFRGVVHLHGSVSRPSGMTLADGDFGRAYITRGWARRFLVDLFRSFTVLFVGYSHDDIVMSYLARALPVIDPSNSDAPGRYALTNKAADPRWKLLDIKPIEYPSDAHNDHSGLGEGLKELSGFVRRRVLDWERAITDIAEEPPRLVPEESDLIEDALSDPVRTRFFHGRGDRSWLD